MFRSLAVVSLLTFAAGCGAADGSSDDPADVEALALDGKADALTLPKPADATVRVYFDAPADAYVSEGTDDNPWAYLDYRVFNARGGQEWKVGTQVIGADGTTDFGNPVGFKLHTLARDTSGKLYWRLITSRSGQGSAGVRVLSWLSRTYLIESTANNLPAHLRVTLSCSGIKSTCAMGGQPGDACTKGKSCDGALACIYPAGSCGAAATAGVCTQPPQVCTFIYQPVCGCDGKTYSNKCIAASKGVSVDRAGDCACDPSKWGVGFLDAASLAGDWRSPGASYYTYSFDGDGSFSVSDYYACFDSNPPCLRPQILRTGSYAILSGELQLTYSDGGSALYSAQSSCAGARRLVGNDFGQTLTLSPPLQ